MHRQGNQSGRGWLKAIVLSGFIVMLAVIVTGCVGKRVDASKLIKPVVWGLNGDGNLRLEVDLDSISEAVNDNKPLTDRQIEQLNGLTSDLQKDYAISKRSGLSNGDVVEITGGLKEDSFSVFDVKINNNTFRYTVSGLADVEEVNLEDYVICEATGFDGEGIMRTEVDWKALYAMIEKRSEEIGIALSEQDRRTMDSVYAYCNENSLSNGDMVTVHMGMVETELASCGLRFNTGDMDFTVSGLAKIEEVRLENYLAVGAQGYNGMGTPIVALDQEKLTNYLAECFRTDGRGCLNAASADTDFEAEAATAAEAIAEEWTNYYDYNFEPDSNLSNGDEIQVSFRSYRGEMGSGLRRIGLVLSGESVSGTAEGLVESVEFDVSQFITCAFSGFDGSGVGSTKLDYAAMREALIQTMLAQRPDVDSETAERYLDHNDLGVFIDDGNLTELSNGYHVSLEIKLDTDKLAEYGIWIVAQPIDLEVAGLLETEPVNLAELITVTFEGVAPHLTAVCEIDWEKEYASALRLSDIPDRSPITADNGDRFTLELPYDAQKLRDMGYRAVNSTFSASVSGVYSYNYSIESANDLRLVTLIDMGRERAWKYALDNSASLPDMIAPDRDSRILWDRVALDYAGIRLGQMDTESRSSNAMFLLYRFAAPVRYMNQEAAAKSCWIAVSTRNVLLGPDGSLSPNEGWGVEVYSDQAALEAFIEHWMTDNLGEECHRTNLDSDTEMAQIDVPEPAQIVGREPGVAGDGIRTALLDIVPSYAANTSEVETVVDPYGTEHTRSLGFNVDKRAKAEYELNGRYSVFSGTMSTYNEANTNARMSLYIWGDGTLLFRCDAYQRSIAPIPFSLDVSGVRLLSIQTRNLGEKDRAWLYINEGELEAASTVVGSKHQVYSYNELHTAFTSATENRRGKGLVMNMYNDVCRDLINLHSWENGTHAISLNGEYTSFRAKVLIWNDDKDARATASLSILADGREVWCANNLTPLDGIQFIGLDMTGVSLLEWRSFTDSDNGIKTLVELYDTEFDRVYPDVTVADVPEIRFAEIQTDVEIGGSICTGNYRYVLVNQPSTLEEAQRAAEATGGALAMPKSDKAMRAVSWLVAHRNAGCDGYWLGGSKKGFNVWKWNDGTVINMDNAPWSRNQPDNHKDQEYLLGTFKDGTWNDYAHDVLLGYVLEFPIVSGIAEEGVCLGALDPIQADRAEISAILFKDMEHLDPYGIWLDSNRNGSMTFNLDGEYEKLSGTVISALDASVNARGRLAVFGDGRLLWQAPELKVCEEGFHFDIDVAGVDALTFQTGEFTTDDEFKIVIGDAMLIPAPQQALSGDVNVLNTDAIDQSDAERQWVLFCDPYDGLHQGGMKLNASRNGHVMYNISGHRTLTGTLCGGWETLVSEKCDIRILVDGQEVLRAEDFSLLSAPVPFELDIENAVTVEFIAESESQADNRIYVCDLIAN